MSPERQARLILEDLAAAVDSEMAVLDRIARAVAEARRSMGAGGPDAFRCAYFAVELARYYTAFEHCAEMIERALAVLPPRSERWHQDLLDAVSRERTGVRPPVIATATRTHLQELLGFRHFVRNAYAVELAWEEHLERHTRHLEAIHACLSKDLRDFVAHLRRAATAIT